MRSGHILTTAVAATALVGISAPAAMAGITPNPASPGQIVTVSDDGRCGPNQGATATSSLFGEIPLFPDGPGLAGRVQIPPDTKPGKYKVVIRCVITNERFTDILRVRSLPHGGVDAGGGGFAPGNTADASGSHTAGVAGAAALATLVGGVYALMRRRAAERA